MTLEISREWNKKSYWEIDTEHNKDTITARSVAEDWA